MKKFWEKAGWICMTILPAVISLAVQLMMGIALGIFLMVIAMSTPELASDTSAMEQFVTDGAMKYNGMIILVYHILATLGFGLWYYLACGKAKPDNPLPYFKKKALPVTVILAVGLCFFANSFVLVGQYVAPQAIDNYMQLMEAAGLGVDTFAIIASIFLAPVGEELLCRGLTYHYAQRVVANMTNRRIAFWIANTLQAAMFGIMHGNLIQGLYAFLLGLGLGWLRERYHSLYPAMLAHAIVNFLSTFVVGYPLSLLPETFISYLLLMLVSIAVIAAALCIAGKESKQG